MFRAEQRKGASMGMSMRIQRLAAAAVFALGVALMAVMIVDESEPGALPVLLVIIGGGWWFALHRRSRKRRD